MIRLVSLLCLFFIAAGPTCCTPERRQVYTKVEWSTKQICEEVFGDTELVYTKPATRLTGHLAGYDPKTSPKFEWPERLKESKKKILEDARKRGANRKKEYKN